MTDLKKRNKFLDSELVYLNQVQEDCEKSKHIQSLLNGNCESLKEELKKERDIIRVWTKSGKITHEALYKNEWKKGLGYTDVEEEVKKNKQENMFQPVRPLSVPVKFVNYKPPLKLEVNNADNTKLDELEPVESKKSVLHSKKYKIPIVKKATKIYKVKEKNIGLVSKGNLENKINDITGRIKSKPSKRNRNGKQGIDKSNNYAYIQNAPRKTCFNCGNTINFIQLYKVDTKLSQEQVSQELLGHKEYSSYVITINVKPILYL